MLLYFIPLYATTFTGDSQLLVGVVLDLAIFIFRKIRSMKFYQSLREVHTAWLLS